MKKNTHFFNNKKVLRAVVMVGPDLFHSAFFLNNFSFYML
jgi:hypothetical protein